MRFGIRDPNVMRNLWLWMDGVAQMPALAKTRFLSDAFVASTSTRRATLHRAGNVHDTSSTALGTHWAGDWSPKMPMSLSHNAGAMIFAERGTSYVFTAAMPDGTTSSFIKALEQLRFFVKSEMPGTQVERLTLDSDPCWRNHHISSPLAKHLHVAEFQAYLDINPLAVQYSPPETQALNPAEGITAQL
jgi:hypothetical protein